MSEYRYAHCAMEHEGRTLLGQVFGQDGDALTVRHFNGELWPIRPTVAQVTILERDAETPLSILAESLRNPWANRARSARVLSDWVDVQRERGKTHRDLRVIAQRLVPGLTGGEFDEAMAVADEAES